MAEAAASASPPRTPAGVGEPITADTAEFLERIPSLAWRGLIYVLILFTIAALVWSYLAQADVVVMGAGTLIPKGDEQQVQAPVSGEVVRVLVREGEVVKEGGGLLLLDSPEVVRELANLQLAEATLADAKTELEERLPARAQFLRRRADALAKQQEELRAANALLAGTVESDREAYAIQRRQAELDVGAFELQAGAARRDVQMVDARLEKAQLELERTRNMLKSGVARQSDLRAAELEVETLRLEVGASRDRQAARAKDLEKARLRLDVLEAEQRQQRQRIEQQLRQNAAQLAALEGQVAASLLEIEASRQAAAARVAEATRQAQHARASTTPGVQILEGHVVVRAPTSGTIIALSSERRGNQVQRGDLLARLAPLDAPLVARVEVSGTKVPYVREGQEVKLKLPAYPYEEYGVFRGEVSRVSEDVSASRADPGGEPVFSVEVELRDTEAAVDGEPQAFRIGLAVNAEIVTRKQRVIELLFAPFRSLFGENVTVER